MEDWKAQASDGDGAINNRSGEGAGISQTIQKDGKDRREKALPLKPREISHRSAPT